MPKYRVTFEIDAHGTRVDEIVEATTDWMAVLIAQKERLDEGKAGHVVDCQEMAGTAKRGEEMTTGATPRGVKLHGV